MKIAFTKNITLSEIMKRSLILLAILFTGFSAVGQEYAQEEYYFDERDGFFGGRQYETSTYIQSGKAYRDGPKYFGMRFVTEEAEVMKLTATGIDLYRPLLQVLDMRNNINLNDLKIINTRAISGMSNLALNGIDKATADLYITGTGLVGIGTGMVNPAGRLHVKGSDNTGFAAALTIESSGNKRMLLGGGEIATTASALKLQYNRDFDIRMVDGGGSVGIGLGSDLELAPLERLHLNGNLRLDNGMFLSSEAMVFRTAVGENSSDNNFIFQNNAEVEIMRINQEGNLGIGTNTPTQKLEVVGTVKATSFVSSAAIFPDYVFEDNYDFVSLGQLDAFIQENKHLPNMPTEKDVVENGLNVTDVVIKSVENIENIYLHLIQMNEKLDALQKENDELKALLNKSL